MKPSAFNVEAHSKATRDYTTAASEYESTHNSSVAALDKKIEQYRRLRGKISPGQKPLLRGGTPGGLRALEGRRKTLLMRHGQFDDTPQGKALAENVQATSRDAWENNAQMADTHYADLVNQFAQRHLANGGTEPTYVPYSAAPSQSVFGNRGVSTSTTAMRTPPSEKASTGYSARTGDFRFDPAAPLRKAQVAAKADLGLHNWQTIVKNGHARPLEGGDTVRPGHVIVRQSNLRSIINPRQRINIENVGSANDPTLLEKINQSVSQLHGALADTIDATNGVVPKGEKVFEIPKPLYDELVKQTSPGANTAAGRAFDQANRQYQRALLSKPGTVISNSGQSVGLAMIGGAGPLSIKRGLDWHMHHPDYVPDTLKSAGPGGSVYGGATTKIGKGIDHMLAASRYSEDAAAAMLWAKRAHPVALDRMKKLGQTYEQAMRDLASGRATETPKLIREVTDFLGALANGKNGLNRSVLGRSIMFQGWLKHIITLTYHTMPVKYPGRTLFLQRVSQIGDEYRKKHGILPDWYGNLLPIGEVSRKLGVGGLAQTFERVINSNPVNVFNNAGQALPLPDQSSNFLSGPASAVTPLLSLPYEAATGSKLGSTKPIYGNDGKPISTLTDRGKAVLHDAISSAPWLPAFLASAGTTNTSIPGDEHYRSQKYREPATNKIVSLPGDFRTGLRPLGGNEPNLSWDYALGVLTRLAGAGVSEIPTNKGPINVLDSMDQIKKAMKTKRANP